VATYASFESITADGDPENVRAMGRCSSSPKPGASMVWPPNNDGIIDVDNFDDAALSAAGYLCDRGGDLAIPKGWTTALRTCNHSDLCASTVRDWATAYAHGHAL